MSHHGGHHGGHHHGGHHHHHHGGFGHSITMSNFFSMLQGLFVSIFGETKGSARAEKKGETSATMWESAMQSKTMKRNLMNMSLAPFISLVIFFFMVTGWLAGIYWLRHHDDRTGKSATTVLPGERVLPGPAQSYQVPPSASGAYFSPSNFGVSRSGQYAGSTY